MLGDLSVMVVERAQRFKFKNFMQFSCETYKIIGPVISILGPPQMEHPNSY